MLATYKALYGFSSIREFMERVTKFTGSNKHSILQIAGIGRVYLANTCCNQNQDHGLIWQARVLFTFSQQKG